MLLLKQPFLELSPPPPPRYGKKEEKCCEHFYLLHLYGSLLFSGIIFRIKFSYFPQPLDNGMALGGYCSVHEFRH